MARFVGSRGIAGRHMERVNFLRDGDSSEVHLGDTQLNIMCPALNASPRPAFPGVDSKFIHLRLVDRARVKG